MRIRAMAATYISRRQERAVERAFLNPAATIADLERVEVVFEHGVGDDPKALIAAAKGSVGLR